MMATFQIEPFAGEWLEGAVAVLQAALHAAPISRSLFVRKALLDPIYHAAGFVETRRFAVLRKEL